MNWFVEKFNHRCASMNKIYLDPTDFDFITSDVEVCLKNFITNFRLKHNYFSTKFSLVIDLDLSYLQELVVSIVFN